MKELEICIFQHKPGSAEVERLLQMNRMDPHMTQAGILIQTVSWLCKQQISDHSLELVKMWGSGTQLISLPSLARQTLLLQQHR